MKIGDKFLIISDCHGNVGRLVEVWEILGECFKPRVIGDVYEDDSHYGEYFKITLEDIDEPKDKLVPISPAIKILFGV